MMRWQYNNLNLKRVCYATFKPVKDTPLQNDKPVPDWRENRLYNIDFLHTKYQFTIKEFDKILEDDMLPIGEYTTSVPHPVNNNAINNNLNDSLGINPVIKSVPKLKIIADNPMLIIINVPSNSET